MESSELQTMADAYITCALFTAQGELIPERSGEFDPSPYTPRVPASMRAQALQVCTQFYAAHCQDLADYPADSAGHDLWYTRNGHGVGFWENDHCTDAQGKRLTDAAHRLGECSIYRARGGWFSFE